MAKKNNNIKPDSGMTEIVKTITALVEAAILIYGINITLYGHLTPGGGFAGGVIIAFLFILLYIAYGKETALKKLRLNEAHVFDSLGIVGLLFLLSLTFFGTGHAISNFINKIYSGKEYELFSAGPMMLENIAIAVKVGVSLFMVFAVLSVFGKEKRP
ncbi:MAG: MnhB domain-containing protein [Elusimicrobiota bacterium]|nr:MnhB domain-containing protein [Elusimicrobiota bacterium]